MQIIRKMAGDKLPRCPERSGETRKPLKVVIMAVRKRNCENLL